MTAQNRNGILLKFLLIIRLFFENGCFAFPSTDVVFNTKSSLEKIEVLQRAIENEIELLRTGNLSNVEHYGNIFEQFKNITGDDAHGIKTEDIERRAEDSEDKEKTQLEKYFNPDELELEYKDNSDDNLSDFRRAANTTRRIKRKKYSAKPKNDVTRKAESYLIDENRTTTDNIVKLRAEDNSPNMVSAPADTKEQQKLLKSYESPEQQKIDKEEKRLQRQKDLEIWEAYKASSKAAKRATRLEDCKNHGSMKYPCCNDCCRHSYMGCF